MKKTDNKTSVVTTEKTPVKHGGLRLIQSDEEKKEEPPKSLHGKNNSFVSFMSSYADSIDQEIKALLDL